MSTYGKHDDCSVDDVVRLRLGEDPPSGVGIGFIELDDLATGEQSPQLYLLRRTTHLSDDWSGDDDK